MKDKPNDVVKVAAGEMVAMELYKQALIEAGIEARVMGESLGASFGTAIPGSVELWVHRSQEKRARGLIAKMDRERGKQAAEPGSNPPAEGFPKPQGQPRPTSAPKPKPTGRHGPHTHYNPDPRP